MDTTRKSSGKIQRLPIDNRPLGGLLQVPIRIVGARPAGDESYDAGARPADDQSCDVGARPAGEWTLTLFFGVTRRRRRRRARR